MSEILDKLETRIAPRLDRKEHTPIRSEPGAQYYWEYWRNKDYPGYGTHGSNSSNWDDTDWETAIDIFEDRIHGRFLNLIKTIEKKPSSSFSILALDCLLCETLQQFYDGEDESISPTRDFVRFLTSSSFKQYFGTDNTPKTSMAAVFYKQIRCGILHQAEVTKTSLIKIEDNYLLVDWIDSQHTGLIVNRKKFHHQLDQEFCKYLASLRKQPIVSTSTPWDNFKKKMDFICRI
jgi:hypothetical protein